MSGRIFGRMSSAHRLRCARRSIAGKAEPEGGAVTGAALDRDRAPMLFENAMADGESESGAAGSGAESRFKDARQIAGRNARPGVANQNFDPADFDATDLDAVAPRARRAR